MHYNWLHKLSEMLLVSSVHGGEVNVQTVLSFVFLLTIMTGVAEKVRKVNRLHMINNMVLSIVGLFTHRTFKHNLPVLCLSRYVLIQYLSTCLLLKQS